MYQAIWQNMARENDVMNYRITWAILFSAGIFAATSILAAILVPTDSAPVRAALLILMCGLSATGAYFSIRTQSGVLAAHEQHNYLKAEYERHIHTFEGLGWPRTFGEQTAHDRGNRAAIVFPELLIRIWITAGVIELALAAIFATLAVQQWLPDRPTTEAPSAEQISPGEAEVNGALIGFVPVLPPPVTLPRPSPARPLPSS